MKNLISKFIKLQAIGIGLLIIIQAAYFDLTLFREGLEIHNKVISFTLAIGIFALFSILFLLRIINPRFYYVIYQFVIAASIVGIVTEFIYNGIDYTFSNISIILLIAITLTFRGFISKGLEEETRQSKTVIKVGVLIGTIISILVLSWPLLEL